MGKQETDWAVGDNCFLIVSISKRYIQEFEVQGFNGSYYTIKRGNYLHHVAPSRMFRTKDEALASLDTRGIPTIKNTEKPKSEKEKEKNDMNEYERLYRLAERHRETYPPGTRIMLLSMGNDPRPIEPNTRGTVKVVDDIGTLHCAFDNGRSLGIVPGEDSFRKLTAEELAEENQDMGEDNTPVMGM